MKRTRSPVRRDESSTADKYTYQIDTVIPNEIHQLTVDCWKLITSFKQLYYFEEGESNRINESVIDVALNATCD